VSGAEAGQLWAMAIMMAAPFLVVVVIGGGLARASRRERREAVERSLDELRPEGGVADDAAGDAGPEADE